MMDDVFLTSPLTLAPVLAEVIRWSAEEPVLPAYRGSPVSGPAPSIQRST